ncbi:MAG: Uma2 family endonuclease [Blastocatellia bacterium]
MVAHESFIVEPELRYTIEEYLGMERVAEERHEYLDGFLIEMAGESGEHGDISSNLVMIVGTQLRGTPCRARTKDTKVRSGPMPVNFQSKKGLFSYPDLVVIRGDPQYLDRFRDVITNPSVIIEVLSESTANFDRGQKFFRYSNWNPTLSDYVLVSQHIPFVEIFSRQADGSWNFRHVFGLECSLRIPSIQCTLNLTEVYDRIVFPIVPILEDDAESDEETDALGQAEHS